VLAAGTVYPRREGPGAMVALPLVLTLALAVPFCLAYYGKERMNYFSPEEVAASTWLYDTAPTGSFVLSATASFPWAFSHYEDYDYEFLEGLPRTGPPVHGTRADADRGQDAEPAPRARLRRARADPGGIDPVHGGASATDGGLDQGGAAC